MRVGINPITNSPQRTQQKQQSFGIFRCTHPMNEVAPVVRRAEQLGIKLFVPYDVASFVSGKCLFTSNIFKHAPSDYLTFANSLEGCLYTEAEQNALLITARTSDLTHLVRAIFRMKENPKPLDFHAFKSAVDALEETTTRINLNKTRIEEAMNAKYAAEKSNEGYYAESSRQRNILRILGVIQ